MNLNCSGINVAFCSNSHPCHRSPPRSPFCIHIVNVRDFVTGGVFGVAAYPGCLDRRRQLSCFDYLGGEKSNGCSDLKKREM